MTARDEFGDLSDLEMGSQFLGGPPIGGTRFASGSPMEDMSVAEFQKAWSSGISSERSLGKPREWNGKEDGFDTFVFRLSNWLSAMPGNCEECLDEASRRTEPVNPTAFSPTQIVMSKGVMQALRSLVDGKALDIVKSVPAGNGFEAWRRLFAEYKPQTAGRKVSMLEAVMEDRQRDGEDFSTWYYRWKELVRQAESARGRVIDDDIKCAVVLRRSPRELRDHLLLAVPNVDFSSMNATVVTWMLAKKSYSTNPATSSSAPAGGSHKDPNAMEIGAMNSGWDSGKSYGKSYGKQGKQNYDKGGKSGKGFGKPNFTKGFGKQTYGKGFGKQSGKGHYNDKGFGKQSGKSFGKFKGKSESYGGKSSAPDVFPGYCGGCWEWGHKKAHCPQRPKGMDVGAVAGHGTSSVSTGCRSGFSDPGSSISAHVGALSSLPMINETDDGEDWHEDDPWAWPWVDEDWNEHDSASCRSWWTEDWPWQEEVEHQICEELYMCSVSSQAPWAGDTTDLMIDSGSQSTACRPDFAPEYGIDDSEVARLRDIQDNLIPAYGKKVVDVQFLGDDPESTVNGCLKMDVGDVSKNVASMGRLLRAGFDLHFTQDGHKCWMEKGGKVTQVYEDDPGSEAPLYHMRLRVMPPPTQRGSPATAPSLVAPIVSESSMTEGCEVELAGLVVRPALNGVRGRCIRRDVRDGWWCIQLANGKFANLRDANLRRLDEPAAELPKVELVAARVPILLRTPGEIPSKAVVEAHNLAHLPTAPWCEVCIAAKGCMDQFHSQAEMKVLPQVQIDYQYMSASGDSCGELQSKATLLTVVDVDQGYMAQLVVSKKGDDAFAIRFVSSFLDRMRCDEVRLKHDNEPSLTQLVDKVKCFRMPRKTTLEPIIRAEHEMVGAVERAHRTLQANMRAMKLDIKARFLFDLVPGHTLFAWLARHVAWCVTRFQPRGARGTTAYESRTGNCYKSPLVPFAETVMVRVPIDPPGMRRKLDSQWLKGVWVGRTDESDAHIVLTPHGTVTGRSVRRLPSELRFQRDLLESLTARVSDPAMSQARILKVLPLTMPIRLEGETDVVPAGAELPTDDMMMDTEVLVDDAAPQSAEMLPAGAMELDNGAEELGDAMATGYGEVRPLPDAEEPPATRARIGAVEKENEPRAEYYDLPKVRTPESIVASRKAHIEYLLASKSVKDWDRAAAQATGALVLTGRFVDDDIKEKSRYCAREYATVKDPTVFAAASDVDATAIVDLFATKKNYPVMCFDAVAAFSQADEQELVFLVPPREHLELVQKDVLWQCLKVREGRRNGARSWQEHFLATITSSSCPGKFKQNPKSPSMYYSSELDILMDLHVDDGYVAGPESALKLVFDHLSKALVIKISPLVLAGSSFEHVGTRRTRTADGMWIQAFDKYVTKVLELLGMNNCNSSTSPKLDKAHLDGDELPCEDGAKFRTAVCTLLYVSKRQPEIQSTVRWLCKRLKDPTGKAWRQLIKLVRYMKASRGLATFFPCDEEIRQISGYVDGDWACDDFDRKSVSGGVIMVAGCRMHSHSRGTADHALSSGESEIMSMSELLKDCLLLQFNMQFAGMGKIPIQMYTDASVCRQFVHRRGVGRMKHLDVRHMWLQDMLEKGAYSVKKISREVNPSDMMTHPPSSQELEKFLPMIGIYPFACSEGGMSIVKTALASNPRNNMKIASLVLASVATRARGDVQREDVVDGDSRSCLEFWTLSFVLVAISWLMLSLAYGWVSRRCWAARLTKSKCTQTEDFDFVEKVAVTGSSDRVAAQYRSYGAKRELPGGVGFDLILFSTPEGECFHADANCFAIRGRASTFRRRPCKQCFKG